MDARRVGRNTPRRHEAQCRICKHAHRAELEDAYVDGALGATQLALRLEVTRWTVWRHMRYFGLQEQRATNALPYLGSIMRRGALARPTAADAIAAALAIFKITNYIEAQVNEHMERIDQQTVGALLVVLQRLDLDPIYYKRAGEILEQELNRRMFGATPDECPDAWNLAEDALATIDTNTRLVVTENSP